MLPGVMMNKITLTSAMLVSLFAASVVAAGPGAIASGPVTVAANGSKASAVVNFEGEIVASTCVVTSGNQQGKTVTLPQVTNQLFGGNGTTVGDTPFTLDFTGCTGSTGGTGYTVVFTGTSPVGRDDLLEATRTGSNPGNATDVGIEVVKANGNALKFSSANNEIKLVPDATGNASINMVAKYQQIGSTLPAAGALTANMTYTVIYK